MRQLKVRNRYARLSTEYGDVALLDALMYVLKLLAHYAIGGSIAIDMHSISTWPHK